MPDWRGSYTGWFLRPFGAEDQVGKEEEEEERVCAFGGWLAIARRSARSTEFIAAASKRLFCGSPPPNPSGEASKGGQVVHLAVFSSLGNLPGVSISHSFGA